MARWSGTVVCGQKAFKEGQEEVTSGCPTLDAQQQLEPPMKTSSMWVITDTLNLLTLAVHGIVMEDLQMRKRHKKKKSFRSEELLELTRNDPGFLNSILTGNKSSMYKSNPVSERQGSEWHTRSSPIPKKACISNLLPEFAQETEPLGRASQAKIKTVQVPLQQCPQPHSLHRCQLPDPKQDHTPSSISMLAGNKEMLTLLQFPPQDANGELVTVIEVGPSTNACPQGLYVVHMTCRQVKSAREDLAVAVSTLLHTEPCEGTYRSDTLSQATLTHKLEDGTDVEGAEISQSESQAVKPQLLWSLYFNCPETSSCDLSADVPSNVHLCSGPDLDLDFEFAVKQAKEIFKKMYPDCEFLPRAPDPEEIVLDDDSEPGPAFIDNKTESDHDKQDIPSGDTE
ncbi:hypothetical protein J6590_075347 [Homalodisca vitripennis]|nr:hypothetical protein J6590_075347 [Homalodisca vitripennis]